MRLLLSICLLLASVVAARAQALTWHAPGSPMHGEALLDSYATSGAEAPAERVKPSGGTIRLSAAFAWTVSVDDGAGPLVWLTGAPAAREALSRFASEVRPDHQAHDDAFPHDDRRAIRAFRRTLLPPDIA